MQQKAITINDNIVNNQNVILENLDNVKVGKNKNLIFIDKK